MKISGYEFDGPYTDAKYLRDVAGVYVISGMNQNNEYYIIDVGESSTIQTRISNHDRADCWARQDQGQKYVFVKYITWDVSERMALEQKIRNEYAVPCGSR